MEPRLWVCACVYGAGVRVWGLWVCVFACVHALHTCVCARVCACVRAWRLSSSGSALCVCVCVCIKLTRNTSKLWSGLVDSGFHLSELCVQPCQDRGLSGIFESRMKSASE